MGCNQEKFGNHWVKVILTHVEYSYLLEERRLFLRLAFQSCCSSSNAKFYIISHLFIFFYALQCRGEKLDEMKALCPHDLLGRCNDTTCQYQHLPSARSSLQPTTKGSVLGTEPPVTTTTMQEWVGKRETSGGKTDAKVKMVPGGGSKGGCKVAGRTVPERLTADLAEMASPESQVQTVVQEWLTETTTILGPNKQMTCTAPVAETHSTPQRTPSTQDHTPPRNSITTEETTTPNVTDTKHTSTPNITDSEHITPPNTSDAEQITPSNTTDTGETVTPNTTDTEQMTLPNTTNTEQTTMLNTTDTEQTTTPNTTDTEQTTMPNTTDTEQTTTPNTTGTEQITTPNTTDTEQITPCITTDTEETATPNTTDTEQNITSYTTDREQTEMHELQTETNSKHSSEESTTEITQTERIDTEPQTGRNFEMSTIEPQQTEVSEAVTVVSAIKSPLQSEAATGGMTSSEPLAETKITELQDEAVVSELQTEKSTQLDTQKSTSEPQTAADNLETQTQIGGTEFNLQTVKDDRSVVSNTKSEGEDLSTSLMESQSSSSPGYQPLRRRSKKTGSRPAKCKASSRPSAEKHMEETTSGQEVQDVEESVTNHQEEGRVTRKSLRVQAKASPKSNSSVDSSITPSPRKSRKRKSGGEEGTAKSPSSKRRYPTRP